MLRRVLLILLVAMNAATPALAGACAMRCAFADPGAAAVAPDCHGEDVAQDPGANDGTDGAVPDGSLMQAACAFAATAAVVPLFVDFAAATMADRIASAAPSSASRPTPPPDQPPRA